MADPKNPGQFGNRPDTIKQGRKGGKASSAKRDMSALGKEGAEAQPTEAKRRGGHQSHRNDNYF
jgi:hypothetical protein